MSNHAVICEACSVRVSIKTDGSGRYVCEHCAYGLPDPFHKPFVGGRNWPCKCGSGKKRKHCCGRIDS